jgi:hypothetical protein
LERTKQILSEWIRKVKMGYCNNCGKPVTEDMDFCSECGHSLVTDEKETKVDNTEKQISSQEVKQGKIGLSNENYKDRPTDTVSGTDKKPHTQEKATSDIHTDIGVATPRMADKYIPKQIRNILAKDETVERRFKVDEYWLYTTDRRLIQVKDRNIRDFDFAHISSVTYTLKRYLWLLAIGIPLIILGAVLHSLLDWDLFAWFSIIIGLILIIVGVVHKEEFIEANIVGVSKPTKYKGQRQTLHSLLQLIRQKQDVGLRTKEPATKDIDSIEAIRKLAELRDQGILTQEEFEQKKKKLL